MNHSDVIVMALRPATAADADEYCRRVVARQAETIVTRTRGQYEIRYEARLR